MKRPAAMTRTLSLLALGAALAPWNLRAADSAPQPFTETPEQTEVRMAPWRAARFGMFIHWGPVSLKGTEIG